MLALKVVAPPVTIVIQAILLTPDLYTIPGQSYVPHNGFLLKKSVIELMISTAAPEFLSILIVFEPPPLAGRTQLNHDGVDAYAIQYAPLG